MIGAIVQARLGSKRLQGKVMLPLAGEPVLWHVLKRLQYCRKLDIIILATSTNKEDRALKKIADELKIPTFFGSLNDVLARYYLAAKKYRLDAIVRITADCPVIDPFIIDEVVTGFLEGEYDCYQLAGAFPDGLDTCIITFDALEMAFKEAKLPSDREHVGTTFFRQNKDRFRIGDYEKFKDKENYRWTLDEPEDCEFLKIVFDELYEKEKIFTTQDIFRLLEKKPELARINSHIVRNEGYLKSIKEDQKYLAGIKRSKDIKGA